jgi:hypothetical protein
MDFSNYITFSNLINMFGRVVFIENINQVLLFYIYNYIYYYDIIIFKKVIEQFD